MITNKLVLCSKIESQFSPGEIKKIEIVIQGPTYSKEMFAEYGCHPTIFKSDFLEASPFEMPEPELIDKKYVVLQNLSFFPTILPENIPLGNSVLDLTCFQINKDPSPVKTVPENLPNPSDNCTEDEMNNLELSLEPGFFKC